MSAINDPVSAGLVASPTRPGGTTTGIATLGEDQTPKLLDFQRTVVPKATVLATLFNPANPSNPKFVDEITTRAGAIGITVVPVALPSPDALDAAFATIATHHPDALAIIADAGTFDVMDRIAAAALAQRLPSFTVSPIYAKYGGLLGYGPAPQALWGRAAYYVKRILDGANPGELPVEQPTQIELWINMKTAKALGADVPFNMQQLADKVVE
jgi:putative tryptophan/tyrosine transport system substrate-binding protein